jgi:protein phosphatase
LTDRFRWGARTDVGHVRQVNQDSLLVAEGIFAVADGMGGYQGGEVASAITVSALERVWPGQDLDTLLRGVAVANEAILGEAAANPRLLGMGTTLAGLVLLDGPDPTLVVVNVGDSRVYRFADHELVQVTQDHSLVETLVREGQLDRSQATDHPQRNILVRALGVASPVEVDYWKLPCRAGERFLICSDGLFNEVADGELAAACASDDDPQVIADQLVELANSRGSRDNVTVVLVDVLAGDAEPMALPVEPFVAVPRMAAGTDETTVAPEITVEEDPLHFGIGTPPAPAPAAGVPTAGQPVPVVEPPAPTLAPPPPAAEAPPELFDPGEPAAPSAEPAPAGGGHLVRNVLFALGVLVVLAVAAGLLSYYARANYFVGFRGDEVVVFQGRPGGTLWFDPTVEVVTDLAREDLTPQLELEVEGEQEFGSLDEAVTYATSLADRAGGEPAQPTEPAAGEPTATPDG